jgi:hypothetical protein
MKAFEGEIDIGADGEYRGSTTGFRSNAATGFGATIVPAPESALAAETSSALLFGSGADGNG